MCDIWLLDFLISKKWRELLMTGNFLCIRNDLVSIRIFVWMKLDDWTRWMVDTSFARMKLFYFNVGKVLIGSYSALVLIVINSRTDAIYVFLQCGTGVFQQRGTGFTVLHWSAANNKTEAIRILLQHSASTTLKDDFGRTSVNFAWTEPRWSSSSAATLKSIM